MADTRVLDILRQVEAGDLTPEQADQALASIGVGPGPEVEVEADARAGHRAVATGESAGLAFRTLRGYERAAIRMERQRARLERRLAHQQRRRDRLHRRLDSGYTVDHLIRLRLHGVTPEYVEEMRDAGYGDLSPEELSELRIHGVSGDYVGEMRELLGDIPVDKMIEFRIHGVTPELVQELHDSGVEAPTPDDVLRWRHTTRGSRFSDAVSTAVEAVGPHVSQLVEAALAEARRHIYEALRVTPNAPDEWRSVDASPPPEPKSKGK